MKKVFFAVMAFGIALPALAEKKEEKQEDRWKISLSGVVVGPGYIEMGIEDRCYRCRDGLTAGRGQFVHEYLEFNNVLKGTTEWYIPPRAHSEFYRHPTVPIYFNTRRNGFTGREGDEYLLSTNSRTLDAREEGAALSGSFEYRVTGGLWLAFSASVSRNMLVSRREDVQYLRVETVRQGTTWPPIGTRRFYPDLWRMDVSRHRIARESEHKHRFYSYVLFAKYDLTRSNRHWSVIPQAGMEVLMEHRTDRIAEQYVQYTTFANDRSGRSNQWDVSTNKGWYDHYRPVAGISLELYPGGKENYVGIFGDARWRFNPDDNEQVYAFNSSLTTHSVNISGRSQHTPYKYRSYPTDWTVLIGAFVRF